MTRPWYRLRPVAQAASTGASAEIDLYNTLGAGGVTAHDFRRDLRALGQVAALTVHINSDGGDVFQALAVYDTLLQHPAQVTARIGGLAASGAGLVAMAADRVEISRVGVLMLHNPYFEWSAGEAADLRRDAELLDKLKGLCLACYRRHTKLADADVSALMDAETWLTADEAVAHGFAASVVDAKPVAARLDLSRFHRVPTAARRLAAAPPSTDPEEPPMPDDPPTPDRTTPTPPPADPPATDDPPTSPPSDPPPDAPSLAAARSAAQREAAALRREADAFRRERAGLAAERARARVTADLEALGARVTPALRRSGLAAALLAVHQSDLTVTVPAPVAADGSTSTQEVIAYDALLAALRTLPDHAALLAGPLADPTADGTAPAARDRRTDAERAADRRRGIADDEALALQAKYPTAFAN